jgi:hypothetical protein
MAVAIYPTPSAGGGIKSIQRGEALAAGNITITSVDTTKSTLVSFPTASSGNVNISWGGAGGSELKQSNPWQAGTGFHTGTYGVYFSNSTTIVATGACRWEVVEFN